MWRTAAGGGRAMAMEIASTMELKQRRPQSTSPDSADNMGENGRRRVCQRQRRERRWREMGLQYFRASLPFGLFLMLLVGASTHRIPRLVKPKGADAVLNESYDGESLSNEPAIDDSSPVLCSRELDVYCPAKSRCCPRYLHEKQASTLRKLLFSDGDDRDTTLITPTIIGYTCLPSSSGNNPPGVCCADERNESDASNYFGSGCAVGYTCAAPISTSIDSNTLDDEVKSASLVNEPHCVRDDSSTPIDVHGHPIDNKYELMPRYRTCPAFPMQDIATPYGLPIPLSAASYHHVDDPTESKTLTGDSDGALIGQLAYFTNMGPLTTTTNESSPDTNSHIKTAVITIHGSGRDALSYLCAIIAAVADITPHAPAESSSNWMEDMFHQLDATSGGISKIGRRHLRVQNKAIEKGEILTIAPWFLAPADGQPKSSSTALPFLQWNDDWPIEHTFRYGAESMEVPVVNTDGNNGTTTTTISSFAVLDVLLETLCNKANYPQLERIIVVGHSAGGQVVHRWGLSSDSWCFGDDGEGVHPTTDLPSIRLVAANPRNYAYLDKRRYFPTATASIAEGASIIGDNGVDEDDKLSPFERLEFRLPTESELNDCREYDEYIWGLENNPNLPAPYVTSRIKKLMASGDDDGRTRLFCRYASRDVVYLSGERDDEELNNQIADGDGYQGLFRRERSERFYAALQVLGNENLPVCTRDRGYDVAKGLRSVHMYDEEKTHVHSRIVVENVGHDHSLIFQSPEGLASMFSVPDKVVMDVDAITNENGESSNEPAIDDSTPVLCSRELDVYCPPKTKCCPRYRHEKHSSSTTQVFDLADGRDSTLKRPSVIGYTCLPSSSGKNPPGVCCADERNESDASNYFGSGCAVGYTCAAPISSIDSNTLPAALTNASLVYEPHCIRDDSSTPIDLRGRPIDNKYDVKPRYRTCPAFSMQDIATPFGLPIPFSAASYHHVDEPSESKKLTGGSDGALIGQLAYYTNMGPLTTTTNESSQDTNSHIKTAVIAIHGARRDALSYLCAIIAAVAQNAQRTPVASASTRIEDVFHPEVESSIVRRHLKMLTKRANLGIGSNYTKEGEILTIAPWFLSPADGQPESSSSLPFLQWNRNGFQYGAESIEVPFVKKDESSEEMATVSSFAVLDVLLETLCNKANYPQLERILVVGHSAGGQTVHLWGLISDSWCFGDDNEPATDLPSIRLVAANPRNYAYLDKRRYFPTTAIAEGASIIGDNGIDGEDTLSPFDKLEFRLPTKSEFSDCREYNEYIWGLENNPRVTAPYVTSRIKKLMASNVDDGDDDLTRLFCRYASRDIVYLSGERDTKELKSEIADGDGYQGPSRRERSERFYAALQVLGNEKLPICTLKGEEETQVHSRIVVDNVGHDHSLMFQSPEGLASMFSVPDKVVMDVDAVTNENGELSNEPTIDDSTLVLCSRELDVYCPPKTKCCPRYRHEKHSSSSTQVFDLADGRDSTLKPSSIIGYTCLQSAVVEIPPGVCCADELNESDASNYFGSGCAVGYTCADPTSTTNAASGVDESSSLVDEPHCIRDDSSTPFDLHGQPIDNKYELMPRYRTCPAFAMQDIAAPYGLPIPLSAANYLNVDGLSESKLTGDSDGALIGQLAYFTNMGPLATATTTSSTSAGNSHVKTAVIVIHGAGRDAQSQLCAIIAAVAQNAQRNPVAPVSTRIEDVFHPGVESKIFRRHLKMLTKRANLGIGSNYTKEGEILTIAPWFLSAADGQPESSSSLPFLQWNGHIPLNDTFRYGAESIEVPIVKKDESSEEMATVSSFAVLDVLLETLCNKANYPQLERILVVGHSAGGQTVHRWGLISDSWCFGDDNEPATDLPSIRLVAANPRNYAYLDKRRYFPTTAIAEGASIIGDSSVDGEDTLSPFDKLEFRLPTKSEFSDCQEYNEYIWGLEDNPRVTAPYVTSRIKKLMASNVGDDDDDLTRLFCRYASRDIVYLSGERDTEELKSEIADGDGYQGPSRRERSERFYAALQVLGNEKLPICTLKDEEETQVHSRAVVDNVGHDHSLMFQSPEGLQNIFSGRDVLETLL